MGGAGKLLGVEDKSLHPPFPRKEEEAAEVGEMANHGG